MQLTNTQIIQLSEAINALDGRHSVQVVDGKPVAVLTTYKLDVKTRWNLASNQGKLQSAIADFNRAKDALIKQHSGGNSEIKPTDEGWPKFRDDLATLNETTAEINLLTVDPAGFGESEVPIAVLTALAPLIGA